MPALKNMKHEAFAQALFAGKSQRVAYREAFPGSAKWKDNTVDTEASKLANTPAILQRLQELQDAAASPLILDRQGRMIILTQIALDENLFPKPRMQAIDLLNKMSGDYTQKIEATINGDLSETASKIAEILDE